MGFSRYPFANVDDAMLAKFACSLDGANRALSAIIAELSEIRTHGGLKKDGIGKFYSDISKAVSVCCVWIEETEIERIERRRNKKSQTGSGHVLRGSKSELDLLRAENAKLKKRGKRVANQKIGKGEGKISYVE